MRFPKALFSLAACAFLVCAIGPGWAGTTERVVSGRYSGLALGGFDPVAYFTDQTPVSGNPAFEASGSGAIWRFRNSGNRAAFLANPEIYSPAFGGHDPVDIARGVAVAGAPHLWLIAGQHLFLFNRVETREAFAAAPDRFLREAEGRWPDVKQGLAQ